MALYRIDGWTIRGDDPALSDALASVYEGKRRPACLCRGEPGIAMYIARAGTHFIVKRMPDSGPQHDPLCDSYEPPAGLSGLGQVLGTAIQESPDDGVTLLNLGFSLSRIPGRAPTGLAGPENESIKTSGTKLSLRGTLHHLWDRAGFCRWMPSMSGKRNWPVIRKYLTLTAAQHRAKGACLADLLYVPEPFDREHKEQIAQRRAALLASITAPAKRARRLMICICEVKEIKASRFGHTIVAKHLPDFPLTISEDLHHRLVRRFQDALALWNAFEDSHLVLIGTLGSAHQGLATLDEIALMVVNDQWLPYEHVAEKELTDALVAMRRRFVRGLRYNLPCAKPLASVVLSDTQPLATAMYIIAPGATEEYAAGIQALAKESELNAWIWNAAAGQAMPPFPPSVSGDHATRSNGVLMSATAAPSNP